MALDFINEKEAEERKREKRLVHLTNELGRNFVDSLKLKSKTAKDQAEFTAKSFLDYIFFEQRKEIAEIHPDHIGHFLLEYAPRKLNLTKDLVSGIPDEIARLIKFLNENGYLKNINPLLAAVKDHAKAFTKTAGTVKKPPVKKDKNAPSASAVKTGAESKVGRNDPCPCGSGKKYKKCCGQGK
jgi:hypothetical protein